MHASIKVLSIELGRDSDGNRFVDYTINFDDTPAAIAAEVFLRSAGREFPLGRIVVAAGASTSYGGGAAISESFDAQSGDLMFRPSLAAMKESFELQSAWGEDLVIPNVSIQRKKE
jgi:hypothetical protein